MLNQDTIADCRFCSLVSKANGEDPIGSAPTADHWLVVEYAQPWLEDMFHTDPQITLFIKLLKRLFIWRGLVMWPILVAPDREYSRRGETRVMHYYRPKKQFAQFAKHEFIVPEDELSRLITALLRYLMKQPNEFSYFRRYRHETNHIREMLVCTHGNVDVACARFGNPIYKMLRYEYAKDSQLRVWRCSHFGGHKFAPTLADFPDGHYWGHLEPDMLDQLVYRYGDVTRLRPFYRGWGGLNPLEQVAEREIWMTEGWDWLSSRRQGKTINKGLTGIKRYFYFILRWIPLKQVQVILEYWTYAAIWTTVQIRFTDIEQSTAGTYKARVEKSGQVMTAGWSPKKGESIELQSVPQFHVQHLERHSTLQVR